MFAVPRWLAGDRGIVLSCVILSLVIFLVDIELPIGLVAGMLYVIPVLIAMGAERPRCIYLVALVATVLTVVAVPLKPPGELLFPVINRPISIALVWVVALMGVQRQRAEREREELLHRLEATTDELRRSNEELRQFASVASHDLREPLRTVSSYLSLLERREQSLDEKGREYLRMAVDGAKRMDALINDLLTYSRLGTAPMNLAPVDLDQVLVGVENGLSTAIAEAGGRVDAGPLPTLRADATQMTQLFQNLVGNAIKYRGPAPPVVTVTARERRDEWEFAVRDNGIGIAKDQQGRLFQMFQRLHTSEEYEGTGIGLALCKKIVERHGGRIWVESEEGKGSTFFFTLSKKLLPAVESS